LEEKLPARQMVVAYNDSLPISQAAKQFMNMLSDPENRTGK